MRSVCLLLLALAYCAEGGSTAPSCKNEAGEDVDFGYAFKYPGGFNYAYMDSDTKLTKSKYTLDTASSSVSQIIMQMNNSGMSYVFWNDQPPVTHDSSAPYAHAKGLMLFTSKGGTASSLWSTGSDMYGQAYLCISIAADEINKLTPLFKITRPTVYATHFEDDITDSLFPELSDWSVDKKWDKTVMTTTVSVESRGGVTFEVFGKAGYWNKDEGYGKDLYSDLVAPAVGDLYMEGWRRGGGLFPPACGDAEVLDILSTSFPGDDWKTTSDHSKWAVGETESVFCVGDLNRAKGQDKRGGATVCIHDESFATQMRAVVATEDGCTGAKGNILMV